MAYGMRGNVFHSSDDGASWAPSQVPVAVSLHADALGADGQLLLGGEGGSVIASSDGGKSFKVVRSGGRETITGMRIEPDGSWWLATDSGLRIQRPNGAKSSAAPASRVQPLTSGNS